jgi:hypothetical protein
MLHICMALQMKKVGIFFTLLLLASCANIVAPTGGPQDRTAPKMVGSSLADSSLNFKGGAIKLNFDENILSTGIVLETFPLTSTAPKVSVHKKTLTVLLPDSILEDNTTYRLNFGNTVKDIYEGTAYNNLGLTFSTGNSLDSLFLQGIVIQAATGKADTGIQVLLYSKINSDSDVTFKKPLYVSKVNETGGFLFTNLPNKSFYIYAVKNTNNNYVYDAPSERIAFLENRVTANNNSKEKITLLSFLEVADTAKPKSILGRKGAALNTTVKINVDTTNSTKRTLDITQPITLTYPTEISNLDKSKIRLFQDSILDASAIIELDSTKKIISIKTDFLQDANYKLQLLEGYIVDSIQGKGVEFKFKSKKEIDYGTIKFQYKKELGTYNKILQLWSDNKLLASRKAGSGIETFNMLSPGTYSFRLIHDENNNGKWDNGSFKNVKRQPEKTEEYPVPILLKANMENKITWEDASGGKR